MSLFRYRVADPTGHVQEILVEGSNPGDAIQRVRRRGLTPIELLGDADVSPPQGGRFSFRRQFDAVDFTDRLAPLLSADLPLERCLAIMEETASSPSEGVLLGEMRQGLHEGQKLSQLVRDRGRQFPPMYAGIVEAGEESGALPEVIGQLREFLMLLRDLRNYVISASIYPVFVVVFSLFVVGVLLGVVIPRLATVLTSGTAKVPVAVSLLLELSIWVRDYWWVGILALIGSYIAGRLAWRQDGVRSWVDSWLLRFPLTRRFVVLSNLGRQARTMALLMRSGVHLLDTVSIGAGVVQNVALRDSIATVTGDLRRGERLSAALARSPWIPRLVIRMIAVGEETGETDVMLDRIADRYDAELRQAVKRALAWFEPMVILALGGGVGLIVYLMFMAIISMWSQV